MQILKKSMPRLLHSVGFSIVHLRIHRSWRAHRLSDERYFGWIYLFLPWVYHFLGESSLPTGVPERRPCSRGSVTQRKRFRLLRHARLVGMAGATSLICGASGSALLAVVSRPINCRTMNCEGSNLTPAFRSLVRYVGRAEGFADSGGYGAKPSAVLDAECSIHVHD
jgi:hypothetical protein